MKSTKKFFNLILLILLAVCAWNVYLGWQKYTAATKKMPLADAAAKIRADESFTPYEKIPEMFTNAVVAVEDRRFYGHHGIDIIGICRAVYNDVKTRSLTEGGSTITQQLAKNMYYMGDDTPSRKIAEMITAFKLEKSFTKREILELYFNVIYYGSGYYNIHDAAEGYFSKQPSEMDDYECTLLAGLPNAPSAYSPDKNPGLAAKRQKKVVRSMVKYGCISEAEGEDILAHKR